MTTSFPSPSEEELADILSLDDYLETKKPARFLLKVSGDSMIGAGIMPGDFVLVDRGKHPHDGEIVIAVVDGEWMMQYYRTRGYAMSLVPANQRYRAVTPKTGLTVAAVVVAVIRKY